MLPSPVFGRGAGGEGSFRLLLAPRTTGGPVHAVVIVLTGPCAYRCGPRVRTGPVFPVSGTLLCSLNRAQLVRAVSGPVHTTALAHDHDNGYTVPDTAPLRSRTDRKMKTER